MESRNCKHGRKAFVFTLTTSVILLVLFALVFVYSQVHAPSSQAYLLSEQLNDLSQQISKAQQYANQLNYSSNSTAYFIYEKFSQSKKTQLDSNKNYLQSTLQKLANQTNVNITYSSINYNDFNLFSSNFNYHWNYSATNLTITGNYSLIRFNFNNPSIISDNCSQTGGQVELKINSIFDKKPQEYCLIELNLSNEILKIYFNQTKIKLSFDNVTKTIYNLTAIVPRTSQLQEGETPLTFTTTSTTNPGWIEPNYPQNTSATKHYATITLGSTSYNTIIIDENSDGTFDAVYFDSDENFTDGNTIELKQNNSKVFLNNNVFLLNIQGNGNSIKLTKLNAVRLKKLTYVKNAPL